MKKRKRCNRPKGENHSLYSKIWRIADGAVADAFDKHPEYLVDNLSKKQIRASVVKRVAGALHGFLREESNRERPAADRG